MRFNDESVKGDFDPAISINILPIVQATSAVFPDLFFSETTMFFINCGSKQVLTPKGEITGRQGDLFIFAPGSVVTMENRPFMNEHYRAIGVRLSIGAEC